MSWSSYQLFAEQERDTGFAADSPTDEVLHMLKLTAQGHDALELPLQLLLSLISNALGMDRDDSPSSRSWTSVHLLGESGGLGVSVNPDGVR